uniref:Uncharacterized protein n=1 Tax=Cacopsylla melanoneura TaxID=428564 RepID=A0A8D8RHJ1_9HEMI
MNNGLNYNLIAPNGQGSPTPSSGQPQNQSPLTPPSYFPAPLNRNFSPQDVNFQPYNPYVGLFNTSSQQPQLPLQPQNGGYPQQLPHFGLPTPNPPTSLSNGSPVNTNPAFNDYQSPIGQTPTPSSPVTGNAGGSWFENNPNNAPNTGGRNTGPTYLHNLPNSGSNQGFPQNVPPLNVPQLTPVPSFNPPQLPRIPEDIPTLPPHLFVLPTFSKDPLTANTMPGTPLSALGGKGLSTLVAEEIPWEDVLKSKNGNIQHRSSEEMQTSGQLLNFDVPSFLALILPG